MGEYNTKVQPNRKEICANGPDFFSYFSLFFLNGLNRRFILKQEKKQKNVLNFLRDLSLL